MRSRILIVFAAWALIGCSASASPAPWTISAAATPSFAAASGSPSPSASPSGSGASASPGASASASPAASASPSAGPGATIPFSLMEFNIEYGGTRIDFGKIVQAVQAADPDVVALEEAEGHTQKLAAEAGYPYANVRTQIISKFPIIDPPGADGRYVYIELAPGALVAVSNVHLTSDPYGPFAVRDGKTLTEVLQLEADTRMPDIEPRLAVLPTLVKAGIPTFLTGDFNAPSHLDWTAATVGKLPQILYPVDWPVSSAIEAAGFKDSYRELHPDPVADPGLTWWAARPAVADDDLTRTDPSDRIDIIYAAGAATPTATKIIGEKDGPQVDIAVDPWGTDHRAVMTTFSVEPGSPPPFVAVDQRLVSADEPIRIRYHGPADEVEVVGGTGISPDLGISSVVNAPDGTWTVLTDGLAAGDYQVQLLAGGQVVSRTPVSIAAVGAKPTLTVDSPTYQEGTLITVSWRDAPGARWDWIGVYTRGADPLVDSYLYYVYTDQAVHGTVKLDGSGSGDWPIPPGEYDAHYLLDDGYTSLAVAPFTVTK